MAISDKFSVVDGTKKAQRAPEPKSGIIKAVYETVDALGGAGLLQVIKYLPAALPDDHEPVTPEQVDKALYNGVYRGYFIHNGTTDRYHIAPLDYFSQRRVVLASSEARTQRKGKTKPRGRNKTIRVRKVTLARPLWHWGIVVAVGAACAAAGFWGGFVLGVSVAL